MAVGDTTPAAATTTANAAEVTPANTTARSQSSSDPNTRVFDVALQRDVLTGVYEGGFKVWECALDLVEYIKEHPDFVKGKTVLEIGCGQGLPGIMALKQGAEHVCF